MMDDRYGRSGMADRRHEFVDLGTEERRIWPTRKGEEESLRIEARTSAYLTDPFGRPAIDFDHGKEPQGAIDSMVWISNLPNDVRERDIASLIGEVAEIQMDPETRGLKTKLHFNGRNGVVAEVWLQKPGSDQHVVKWFD
ncbi:unnamed protein product, partial [Closterium sp. NIES-54]